MDARRKGVMDLRTYERGPTSGPGHEKKASIEARTYEEPYHGPKDLKKRITSSHGRTNADAEREHERAIGRSAGRDVQPVDAVDIVNGHATEVRLGSGHRAKSS
jgi:hypothetical protein